jgi:hypothetical protein
MTTRMEPRKYSTGTKGRIRMHSDQCKEFIRANAPSFELAREFVESLDPGHEDAVWQRFQSPNDILPELQAWLGGDAEASVPPTAPPLRRPDLLPASRIARPETTPDTALQNTRAWLASPEAGLHALTPGAAAELAVSRFYREITGKQAPTE